MGPDSGKSERRVKAICTNCWGTYTDPERIRLPGRRFCSDECKDANEVKRALIAAEKARNAPPLFKAKIRVSRQLFEDNIAKGIHEDFQREIKRLLK